MSLRTQLGFIALGYAAVFLVAAALLYKDHLWELNNPADASGGMHAFGDTVLYIFVVCLLMILTGFLIWVIARFEAFYAAYSKFLLGLSLSAPVCLSVLFLGGHRLGERLVDLLLFRLLGSPFLLAGIGISWSVTRFDRAKKLVSYALLIEGLTLVFAVALLLFEAGTKNR